MPIRKDLVKRAGRTRSAAAKRVTATAGGVSAEPGQGPSADSSGTTAAWARATAQSACGCAVAHSRTGRATSFTTPP